MDNNVTLNAYTKKDFKKDVFDQLRWLCINSELFTSSTDSKKTSISDERMNMVLTLNEKIMQYGYCFNPNSILLLAGYNNESTLKVIYEKFVKMIGEVKADPMYPDFPNQVMEMDEATLRFQQILHYFSTYGIEYLTQVEVSKGWLPEYKGTEKIESDEQLLNCKLIEVKSTTGAMYSGFCKILSKRERMTIPEENIVSYAFFNHIKDIHKWYNDVDIPFKENMCELFKTIFESSQAKDISNYHFCQHTGDIWKCIHYIFDSRGKYHLRTSEKRVLVKLLESYPVQDFRSNLILSNNGAKDIKILLQYLDYNVYSRSTSHKQAVADLRSNRLRSWEGCAKGLLFSKDSGTLEFIGKRPGMLLRMITILYRNGFGGEDIKNELVDNAKSLSTQTLVALNTYFNKPRDFVKKYKSDELYDYNELLLMQDILGATLKENIKYKSIPELYKKKVFVDSQDFNLDLSTIETNNKSQEGGYITSGLAIKIPDEAKKVRFFVYWNDKRRVDVDLHCAIAESDGVFNTIGWDGAYKSDYAVFSGDITHSDAAEYIDIDLDDTDMYVSANIDIYSGASSFGDIDECFVGLMAVKNLNENVKLYNPQNCFFSHYLKSDAKTMLYGYIDTSSRSIIFAGKPINDYYNGNYKDISSFNVSKYIEYLKDSQCITVVQNEEDADVILTISNSVKDKSISLLENNFFMDR
jgi:hypothetical protein